MRHTQEQEERQGNEEHSLDLARPAARHACTSLSLLTVVKHWGLWPANAITNVHMRCVFVRPLALPLSATNSHGGQHYYACATPCQCGSLLLRTTRCLFRKSLAPGHSA